MIAHAPSVIENVPKGMAPSEVIRIITHFSDGSNDFIDSSMWGLSKNERPLLIINQLAYAKALKDPIKIEVNGHMRTLNVVEFDHTFHERTGNKVVDDTEQSVPSRSVIARRRSFSSHLEEPPKKFSKGISEAIAQCKSRDARPPIPPSKVVAFEQEPEVEVSAAWSYFTSVICPHISVHLFCYSRMMSYLMIMFLSMLSLRECHYKYCTFILQCLMVSIINMYCQ